MTRFIKAIPAFPTVFLLAILSAQAQAASAVHKICLDQTREVGCLIESDTTGRTYKYFGNAEPSYVHLTAVGGPFKGEAIATAYEGHYNDGDQWQEHHIRVEFFGPYLYEDQDEAYVVAVTTTDSVSDRQRLDISSEAAQALTPNRSNPSQVNPVDPLHLQGFAGSSAGNDWLELKYSANSGNYYLGYGQNSSFPPYYTEYWTLDSRADASSAVRYSGYNLKSDWVVDRNGHEVEALSEILVVVDIVPQSERGFARATVTIDGQNATSKLVSFENP